MKYRSQDVAINKYAYDDSAAELSHDVCACMTTAAQQFRNEINEKLNSDVSGSNNGLWRQMDQSDVCGGVCVCVIMLQQPDVNCTCS